MATLNAAAESARKEATKAIDVALAWPAGSVDDFEHYMSLVEEACVSKTHADALKAAAQAAAKRLLISPPSEHLAD